MKHVKVLSITMVAAILLGMIAIPVLAEDEIPMWVSSIRVTFRGRNAALPKVVGTVAVRDANHDPVAGANVVVEFTDPAGFVSLRGAETSDLGTASFELKPRYSGLYELCVFNVSKEGWEYDPDLNFETCDTFIVP